LERTALGYMTEQFRNSEFVRNIRDRNLLSQQNRDWVMTVVNKLQQDSITPREIYNLAKDMPESLIESLNTIVNVEFFMVCFLFGLEGKSM